MGIIEIVEDIKKRVPSVKNVLAFYNDGTVYYSGFKKGDILSIPDLGDSCARVIEVFKNIYSIVKNSKSEVEDFPYRQITFSSDNLGIIIIHLGEESNLALFFDKISINKINLGCIETDLSLIEDIMDTTDKELEKIGYDKQNLSKKLAENEKFLKNIPGASEKKVIGPQESEKENNENKMEKDDD